MAKANKSAEQVKFKHKSGFAMGMVIQLTLVIALVGIISMVSVYILEKIADKTALTSTDTFSNASNDSVAAVTTGFDFLEIIILAIVAGIVILAIFSYIPIKL
jgi:hypothetical protein